MESKTVNFNHLFDREYCSSPALSGNHASPRNLMTRFKYNF